MEPFQTVEGGAAAMPAANIDTDVIMPKQFLKGIDRKGLARGVFFDLRFDEAGGPRETFVLNQPPWTEARFLVVGPNFGCGSSREHAVWGLAQLGIRALIGTSFAGIFFDNCARNGLLAITLPADEIETLLALAADPATCRFTIDLAEQVIEGAGRQLRFEIDASRKHALLNGLDPVGVTLARADEIRAFEAAHLAANPWLAPAAAP
ncbi:3-isopropylmalate dehydratase small subunit [Phenylobacterium sp.]|uniref:3-isopropylmalate dehydratase small subunit n=1 Tax=Phenylobacterium sp. TaxID=1871053 RepID=UPI0027318018|nr:3-isopropylmalate dehydratase small subunit [Phenylobacterium sp.]MDP1619261.1 3-isopropylmalate dehydratase small subunit [Phenylobacterium sp.]